MVSFVPRSSSSSLWSLAALVVVASSTTHAQFTCTFAGAKDADSCLSVTDDSNAHCVWCSLGRTEEVQVQAVNDFGFCVSESQAEAMEEKLPNIHCDRYSDDDDAVANDDDEADDDDDAPSDDDSPTDDDTPNTDDDLPDNYWDCLQVKKEKECEDQGCTWCDTKAGFGLCLTGPSAESATNSDWFTCDKDEYLFIQADDELVEVDPVEDPLDKSCILAYLENPTQEGCTSAQDADGNPCEWCDLAGMTNLCLTDEQADMSAALGVSCDTSHGTTKKKDLKQQDPNYDTSCAWSFLKNDFTQEACEAAVDADGSPCEYCTVQGTGICLDAEQADMAGQFGISCYGEDAAAAAIVNQQTRTKEQKETATSAVQDPYDPTCALAYLQDPSKDGCIAAVDADGNPCEFCSLQGALDVCLNAEQAAMVEQLGITCEEENFDAPIMDPYDPSCALAYIENPTEEACHAAVDSDGNECEYCTLQDALKLCLNEEQAEMGEQFGIECSTSVTPSIAIPANVVINGPVSEEDVYDPSCALAYLQQPIKEACLEAADADGNKCEFCTLQGALSICLNAEQAEMGEQMGISCDSNDRPEEEEKNDVALPPDFFDCLQHYMEDDCRSSSCTWCDTEVGIGFCLAPAAAEATKQCNFFDCEFGMDMIAAAAED